MKWKTKLKQSVITALIISILCFASYQYALSTVPLAGPYYLDIPFGDASYYVGLFDSGLTYMVDASTWRNTWSSTNTSAIINACIGNLSATIGGIIHLSPEVVCDDGDITINKNHTSIISDIKNSEDDLAAPQIQKIIIDATDGYLEGVIIRGLYIEELRFYANGNQIEYVDVEDCLIKVSSGYHGVVFEGDGSSNGWINKPTFTDCKFQSSGTDAGWGMITMTNNNLLSDLTLDGCSWSFLTARVNYTIAILIKEDGQCGRMYITNPRIYVGGAGTKRGLKFLRIDARNAAYATGARVVWNGGLTELTSNLTLFDVATSGTNIFFSSHTICAFLPVGSGVTMTAFNVTNSNWSGNNGIIFTDNSISGQGTFDIGTLPTVTAQMDVNVDANLGYITNSYGGISATNNTVGTVLAAQDIWYQLTIFDTDDTEYGLDADHTNDHIVVTVGGDYLFTAHICSSSSASNIFSFSASKNNNATQFANLVGMRHTTVADKPSTNSLSGIIALDAGDTIELWVERLDGAGASKTLTVSDTAMSLIQLSGP